MNSKYTKITAKVVYLTPELANEYLDRNTQNRSITSKHSKNIEMLMQTNQWKENGESIIFDLNGLLKDGQHRLLGCVKTGICWHQVIVEGVDPDVMDTIDTGKNRSAGNVLELSGFKNYNNIAAIARSCMMCDYGYGQTDRGTKDGLIGSRINNHTLKEYAFKNISMLESLFSFSQKNYTKQEPKIFGLTFIATLTYIIGHENVLNESYQGFVKEICGIQVTESSGASWVRNLMIKSKQNKVSLNANYVMGICIKAWNLYTQGNPSVTYIRHDANQPLPIPNKI